MSAIETAETPSATQRIGRVSLNAFEILHVIHDTRSVEKRAAARSRWIWIGAIVAGTVVCLQMVADHFALSREVDTYVSSIVTGAASQNGVINHAIHIASEATILTGGLLIALVWYCWFSNDAKAVREQLLLGFGAVLIAAVLSRMLQVSLPVRLRPMHDLASGFLPLPGIDPTAANRRFIVVETLILRKHYFLL